ncbi:MAG: glycosyltransferase family 1 protein [Bacteroidetes bacterium]|nr:MAG: glycosyltransferase family 1 protein [Bacteroidota bacterium]
MKIAILADPLDNQRAGVHVYTKELIHALIAIGAAQQFVLVRERVDPDLPIEQIAVPNIHLPIGFASLRLFFLIPYLLRRHRVDAVFEPAHFGPFNLPKHIKRITMIHDLTPILLPQYHRWHSQVLQRLFLRGILQRAHLVLTNSHYTQHDIERVYPFTSGKVKAIHLGKHPSFRPVQNPSRVVALGIVRPYFIFVGTIEPRKNLETLLKAFEIFCFKNKAADLVIAGELGWKAQGFEEAYAAHPNQERIHRLGFVDFADLPILYSHSLALVYPSEYEGFGLPLIEAAACGTQLVVAHNSSLAEVGRGVAHFFSTHDPNDLAQKLQDAIEKPVPKGHILAHATQFSWQKCAEEFVQTVQEVVAT